MFRTRALLLLIVLFFVIVGTILFLANVNKEFGHDEHLYVAGGALISKSFMPYRDFPYLHMPYLAFAYGIVFRFTDHLLLAARAVSTIGGLLTIAILFTIAFNLKMFNRTNRLALSVGSTLLVLTNPLFIYTTGRAWNHDLSVLFALGAFFTYYQSITNRNGKTGPFLTGILLGLAIGTRLSFALVVPAFFLSALHPAVRTRRQVMLWLAVGLGLSLAPVGLLLASYPQQFVFDNVGFFRVGAEWLRSRGTEFSSAMTLVGRYRTIRDTVLSDPGNLVLGMTYMICGVLLSNRSLISNLRANFGLSLSILILPFLFIGSLMITAQCCYQYYYALVPFLTLGIMFGMATLANERRGSSGIRVLVLSVLISTAYAHPQYRTLLFRNSTEEWIPLKMHSMSNEIRRHVAYGRVLTLAPIVPLEAGLEIYPEFAPGPFAWRSAHLLPKDRRRMLGIVAPDDLNELLEARPPQAILTGFEKAALEDPLIAYARANRFREVIITREVKLWVSPANR
jgi:4-amino-4-deoxy-L-arabinose transferase-like glycosyltransferase